MPFAAAVGHRASARECLHAGGVGEALSIIAELDEQAGCEQLTRPRQRVKDRGIGVLPEQPR